MWAPTIAYDRASGVRAHGTETARHVQHSGDMKMDDIVPVSRSQSVGLAVTAVAPSARVPSTCGPPSVDPELHLERRTGAVDRRRYTRTDRRRKLTG